MAAYADFEFYEDDFLGTAIAAVDFARLALRASAVIDQITFNRAAAVITADTDETTITAIMMATCAVAETLSQEDGSSGRVVQSERIGSHSVTYADARTTHSARREAASLWLESSGLMFAGFYSGEYSGSLDADE
jgi:hypothetical protein